MKEFRVWDGKEYVSKPDLDYFYLNSDGCISYYNQLTESMTEQPNFEPEFWTGKTDSEGAKIFEKDKLEVSHEGYGIDPMVHLVTSMTEDYPAYDLEPSLSDEMNSLSYITCDTGWVYKVIGTIHEDEK